MHHETQQRTSHEGCPCHAHLVPVPHHNSLWLVSQVDTWVVVALASPWTPFFCRLRSDSCWDPEACPSAKVLPQSHAHCGDSSNPILSILCLPIHLLIKHLPNVARTGLWHGYKALESWPTFGPKSIWSWALSQSLLNTHHWRQIYQVIHQFRLFPDSNAKNDEHKLPSFIARY